jgi:hypothetical protein
MTLQEFIEKHLQDLEIFQKQWLAQVQNADLEYPIWMDYFWGWSEQEWDKENNNDG